MAYVRKIKGALVKLDSTEYVGEDSYLFYDIDTACIRITDGTPGGRPACIEGASGGAAWGTITGTIDDQTDLAPRLIDQAVVTIPAGSTSAAISYTPITNSGSKYVITIVDTVTGEVAVSEVLGSYKALDNSVTHSHYGKIGDKIKYVPELIYSSPDVELQVTNNDTNPITISVTRIPMLSV